MWRLAALGAAPALALAACGDDPALEVSRSSPATVRALRRAFDGAPPVIPHEPMGVSCLDCHGERGIEVPGLGYSPPMPHELTAGMSAISRCTQCHVYRTTESEFRPNHFAGLAQDLRRGARAYEGAPPRLPHATFMRENCLACHSGPAAREEIRTTHPERAHCVQCHVPAASAPAFVRPVAAGAGK